MGSIFFFYLVNFKFFFEFKRKKIEGSFFFKKKARAIFKCFKISKNFKSMKINMKIGDMMATMKKNIADREVKSTRNSNKPVLAFDEKANNNGSNSVRDGVKSTKHSDLKVTTYNNNRPSQPNSSQDQPKQKGKSSKPATPTLKPETKDNVEVYSAQDKKPFIYFMTSLEKHHMEYDESNYFCQIYREHFMQTFQAMMFCKYLKPVDSKVLGLKKMHLPRKDIHKGKFSFEYLGF